MAELKNSALLDDLIRYAQKQTGSGESYSVEALLLAACDCVEGTFSPDSLNTEEGESRKGGTGKAPAGQAGSHVRDP